MFTPKIERNFLYNVAESKYLVAVCRSKTPLLSQLTTSNNLNDRSQTADGCLVPSDEQ